MHELCVVGSLSTHVFFPHAGFGASEEEFGLGVQLGSPVDDMELFENGLFLLAVGVGGTDCSQTLFPGRDVTFQGSQSVE